MTTHSPRQQTRPPRPSVAQRLAAVDDLTHGTVTEADGIWPRAAVWLLRLALEQSVDLYWTRTAPALMRCPMRTQLLALREYAGPDTTARIATLWATLSRASHHHDYELAPTLTELHRWRDQTADLAALLEEATRSPSG